MSSSPLSHSPPSGMTGGGSGGGGGIPSFVPYAVPRKAWSMRAFAFVVLGAIALVLGIGVFSAVFIYRSTIEQADRASVKLKQQQQQPIDRSPPPPPDPKDHQSNHQSAPDEEDAYDSELEGPDTSSTAATTMMTTTPNSPGSPTKRGRPLCSYRDLVFVRKLGKGGFGHVWLVQSKSKPPVHPPTPDDHQDSTTNDAEEEEDEDSSRIGALKGYEDKALRQYETEKRMLTLLGQTPWQGQSEGCPFVVHLRCGFHVPETQSTEAGMEGRRHWIVLEYCPRGSLFRYREKPLRELPHFRRWLAQLALALEFLHDNGIVHRDIKAGNVLVDRAWNIRLADFGLADYYPATDGKNSKWAGTKSYFSPERVRREPVTPAADLFALGVLIYHFVGTEDVKIRAAKEDKAKQEQEMHTLSTTMCNLPVKAHTPPLLEDLFRQLTHVDALQRLTIAGLKLHGYFAGFDWTRPMESD
jgi:hypothetical protein